MRTIGIAVIAFALLSACGTARGVLHGSRSFLKALPQIREPWGLASVVYFFDMRAEALFSQKTPGNMLRR